MMNSFDSFTVRFGSMLIFFTMGGCVDGTVEEGAESEEVGTAEEGVGPVLLVTSTERVNVSSAGNQAFLANSDSPQISRNGRFVVFASDASGLVAGDTNGRTDVFIHDRQTDETTRVSLSDDEQEANGDCFDPVVSEDGRFVAFSSVASNMLPSDPLFEQQVYRRDRQLGTTRLISTPTVGLPNGPSGSPSMTADGARIAYESDATNIVSGDTNGVTDVFVHVVSIGGSLRASVTSSGAQANGASFAPKIAPIQSEFVAFVSEATNLVGLDINSSTDVFRRSTVTGQTVLVSRRASAIVFPPTSTANGASFDPAISDDGQLVAFASSATNVVTGDTNGVDDVFLRNVSAGTSTRLSVGPGGVQSNGDSFLPSISGDMVAFVSGGSNLSPLDTDGQFDVFIKAAVLSNLIVGSIGDDGSASNGLSNAPSIRKGSSTLPVTFDLAFQSTADNLVTGDTNGQTDIFVRTSKQP